MGGQLKAISILLVVCTVFSFSLSLPYPYYQHEQCAVNKLNLTEIAGDWYGQYHKNNLNKKIAIKMSLLDDKTLLTSFYEDGQVVDSFNLTQHASLPGKLENLVNRGTWTMAVPTFVLSVKPDQYMTLYHSKVNGTDDWAIYSRANELSQDNENYEKAVQGLVCMNLVDTKDGKPQLYKL